MEKKLKIKKLKLKKFKVEIRQNCLICKKKLGYRQRTFCSSECRHKDEALRYKDYRVKWRLANRDKVAEIPSSDKIQCLVCGKWYVQVCSHAVQRHGFASGREYREYFELEVKRGVVPSWYRKLKAEQVFENGTVKNLKKGKKYWFVKGDERAGRYQRSPITLARIKKLHTFNK